MNVGLLGGTFDPPHIAHLQAAEVALQVLPLDSVWFLPTGDPPHKDLSTYSDSRIRCAMIRAAIAGNPAFDICPYEIEHPGPHYTVDTISALQLQFPSVHFTFIVGSDSVAQFPNWKEPNRLFELAKVAIFERPDVPISKLDINYRRRAEILPVLPLPVSSSEIRVRIQRKLPVSWLVPKDVEQIIRAKHLYCITK